MLKQKKWQRWHKWLALSFGWLFLLQGITGALLAVEAPLDSFFNPHLLKPESVKINLTGSDLTASDLTKNLQPESNQAEEQSIVAATEFSGIGFGRVYQTVQQRYPDNRVIFIQRPSHGLGVFEVVLDKITGLRVYVDGVSGVITGERGAFTIPKNIFLILHTGVLGGEWLEGIYGLSGLFALLMLITGVISWWPKRLRHGFYLSARSGWLFSRTTHRVLGALLVVPLIPIVITGTLLSFHHWVEDTVYGITGQQHPAQKPVLSPQPLRLYSEAEVDRIMHDASKTVEGAEPNFIVFPRRETEPVSVRLRHEGVWHPSGKSQVWFAPHDLTVLNQVDERKVVSTQQGLNLLYPLHTGHISSLELAAVMAILGIGVLYMGVTGVIIWRRSKRAEKYKREDITKLVHS